MLDPAGGRGGESEVEGLSGGEVEDGVGEGGGVEWSWRGGRVWNV